MRVEEYVHSEHGSFIRDWLIARGLDGELSNEPAEIGFVVFNENEPICAAFLRLIEGKYALLDGLISNPNAESQLRNDGINLVVEKIISIAKHLGIKQIIAFSIDKGTLSRALLYGFAIADDRMIKLDLVKGR